VFVIADEFLGYLKVIEQLSRMSGVFAGNQIDFEQGRDGASGHIL